MNFHLFIFQRYLSFMDLFPSLAEPHVKASKPAAVPGWRQKWSGITQKWMFKHNKIVGNKTFKLCYIVYMF